MNDALWERLIWFAACATVAGVAWIAKSIVKPWSDAALMRSQAFVEHIDKIHSVLTAVAKDFSEQAHATSRQTEELVRQTEMLQHMNDKLAKVGSDQARTCKMDVMASELGVTREAFKELCERVKRLDRERDM